MQRTLASVAALLALSGAAAQQPQRVVIAIARSDGRLVPFAAYDSGRWERAWPGADEAVESTSLDTAPSIWRRRGEPMPALWRVWTGSGGASIHTRVLGVERVDALCSSQLALRTDLPIVRPGQPISIGIATDSAVVPVAAIEEVPRSDRIWTAAEAAVMARFPALEAARAEGAGQQLPREAPLPAPRLRALYRGRESSQAPLYFVAERRFRTPRVPQDAECGVVTTMTGWLVAAGSGTFSLTEPAVFLTDCDGKESRTARPLAVVSLSGQLFWVLEDHGYEDQRFRIAQILETAVTDVIEMYGGGC
jgi:hypothetical protein